jgi:hypothetical protein
MIAVLEQTTLPSHLPLVHDNQLVDSGALLLLGDEPGLRVSGVHTVLPGESVRDRIVALAADRPTLVVAGSRADPTVFPDGVAVRRCTPDTYCTSVWVDLAENREAWQRDHSTIVLCDTEPRTGRTYLAAILTKNA